MTLGEEIRQRREDLGLTQAQLAEASRVPQGRVSEYERGTRLPTIESLQALAKVLGPFEIR